MLASSSICSAPTDILSRRIHPAFALCCSTGASAAQANRKCERFWTLPEFRLYHRKDGKVVKEHDDLLSATRYAIMMLRHARSPAAYRRMRGPLVFPN
jgi:hypothetical protein